MFFFVNFSFCRNNGIGGSLPIHIPTVRFLFSSSSPWSSAQFPRRPLKLRSTIATNRVMAVFKAAGSSCVQPEPDSEDHLQKQQGSTSDDHVHAKRRPQKQQGSLSDTSSLEAKPPSSTTGPSSSGDPARSQGSGGNQSLSSLKAQASSTSSSPAKSNTDNITCGILTSNPPPGFKQLSHISKGIKAAFGVFQGWKVFQKLCAPSPDLALLVGFRAGNWVLLSVKASRFFAKGLKVSQKVLTSAPFTKLISACHPDGAIFGKAVHKDLASLANGFNAFYAAIRIVQVSKGLKWQPQEVKLPDGSSIWKGYKFSKSLLSILDAVAGKNGWAFTYTGKGFLVVKKTVGGIGVIVKAAFLSKELFMIVLKGLAISGGTSLRTNHQRNYSEMLVSSCHRSKPKRLLCMAITNEGNFDDLWLAFIPHGAVRNQSLSSLIFLFQSLWEDFESLCVNFCEEDDLLMVFCLAIPLPTSEIRVLV